MADDELDFALNTNKRSARQGRRAAPPPGPPPPADFDGEEEDENMGLGSKPVEGGPVERPNKAVAGWGEEAPRKPRTRQLGEGFEAIEDDLLFGLGAELDDGSKSPDLFRERLRPSSPEKADSDSDNDIPVIPELEEQADEDMSSRVASAPNVAVNRVATYRELDNDLLRQAAFQVLDNEVDLKLLTKALSPMEELTEEDRLWDWDRLFTEVSSELTTIWEKGMEDGEKEQSEP